MTSKSKAKVLVTGGGGYIGCVLIPKLLDKDYRVKVLDTFYFGKGVLQPYIKQLEVEENDVRAVTPNTFKDVEAVIHLAGLSNDPTAEFNPQANRKINTIATVNLAKMAKKYGVKRLVFASSCSIYYQNVQEKIVTYSEDTPVSPKAPYSLSKYEAENGLMELADNNFCVTALRKGTVHGISPRMRYDLVVNTMIKNAFTNKALKVFCRGVQWRPIIDIADAVDAYYLALAAPSAKVNQQVFNIACDNYQIKDLATCIKHTLHDKFSIDVSIKFEQDDRKDRSYMVDRSKAKRVLGFNPKYQIEKSVTSIVNVIQRGQFADFSNPRYYNIQWMEPILKGEE